MRNLFCIALVLISTAAHSQPAPSIPVGTVLANPGNAASAPPAPYSHAFSQVGHIAKLLGANMQVATDQAMTMYVYGLTRYQVTSVYIDNCTVSPSGDAGGIYTAASKGGTAIVAAAQTYTALTTAAAVQALTINSTAAQTATQLYFSLTTGTTGGPCDIFVDGIGLQ